MRRLSVLLVLALTAAAVGASTNEATAAAGEATASAGEAAGSAAGAAGTTMRYRLDEGQVLVYGAVADIEVEGRGAGDGRHGRGEGRGESETHLEMVFSYTAGEPLAAAGEPLAAAGALLPNGMRALTIEILDVKMTQTRETERGRRRIEMDANGVRIYDGKKLEQQSAWGEIQLPSGLNIRQLLDTPIEAAVDERGTIGAFRDPDKVKGLLQGANFLHLLRRQPIFPEEAISRGSTWQVEDELVMSNPVRLRELYRLPGTETYTAVAAVTQLKRRCLQLSIKADWPRHELAEGGETKASGSATAVVDFATGVMFSYSSKTEQTLEDTVGGVDVDYDVASTASVTYLGDRTTYDKYKTQKPQ